MFRRTIYRITTATAVFLATVAGSAPAYAAEPQILAAYTLPVIIGNITAWIVGLLVGVATLFLTIGGLRRLAAGGDPTEIEKANSAFKNALIGYALAVLAPILLAVVQGWIGG
ncbi:pilin [Dactylosporangium darangshiense]|uniref:Integral membrane protein n=1 Tax=Dactylosporangium darangshiense TaxID=579108 RepID=A0ABP8DN41_9ACTN